MDPDANLTEQRELAREIIKAIDSGKPIDADDLAHDADRLAELVTSLDGWILKGGFLPRDWRVKR